MPRLEPGGVSHPAVELALPKPHEGMHLMNVAPDIVGVIGQPRDGRVAGAYRQFPLAAGDAPQHVVKQREAVGRAMADGIVHQNGEAARNGDGAGSLARGQMRQERRRAWIDEVYQLRRNAGVKALPRHQTEFGFIGCGRDYGCVHRASSNSESCDGCGANLCRSLVSSSRRPGW
jgi:hypothetical protein